MPSAMMSVFGYCLMQQGGESIVKLQQRFGKLHGTHGVTTIGDVGDNLWYTSGRDGTFCLLQQKSSGRFVLLQRVSSPVPWIANMFWSLSVPLACGFHAVSVYG